MIKLIQIKMASKNLFKFGFIVLIMLIFAPLTFLIANTIVSNVIDTDLNDCYLLTPDGKMNIAEENLSVNYAAQRECEDNNYAVRQQWIH